MSLPPYEKFDCRSEGLALRWSKWLKCLKHIFDGYQIDETQSKRRYALLLTYGGAELNDIVESLPTITAIETGDNPSQELKTALTNHFNPQSNTKILRYPFRHKRQTPGTKIHDFYAELRQLAAPCCFNDPKDGCLSKKLREKGLTTPLDLTNLLKHARTLEMTEEYCKQLPQHPQQVNKIHHRSTPRPALTKHRQGAQQNYHHSKQVTPQHKNAGTVELVGHMLKAKTNAQLSI
ncbi:follistatin-related protein 1 [Plakobranchus ocellatus]|uniref:Follistatin-related protein 1 n=1 Tax=Plakobranchus ocellatus TaxID=259542 RepID=A0AAV3YTE8_9GAST|nr:follistatin-related protein 1 [Plakobranchus ocellatus]